MGSAGFLTQSRGHHLLDKCFAIDGWLVDPLGNRLLHGDAEHQVEPKVMQVLVRLAHHAGKTVSRDALLRDVWGSTYLSDEVLSRCVSALRKVFDDDPRDPRVIQTVSKIGYRLIARVTYEVDLDQPAKADKPPLVSSPAIRNASLAAILSIVTGKYSEAEWDDVSRLLEQHFGLEGWSFRDGTSAIWEATTRWSNIKLEAKIVGGTDTRTILRLEHRDRSIVLTFFWVPVAFVLAALPFLGRGAMGSTVAVAAISASIVALVLSRASVARRARNRQLELEGLIRVIAEMKQ